MAHLRAIQEKYVALRDSALTKADGNLEASISNYEKGHIANGKIYKENEEFWRGKVRIYDQFLADLDGLEVSS